MIVAPTAAGMLWTEDASSVADRSSRLPGAPAPCLEGPGCHGHRPGSSRRDRMTPLFQPPATTLRAMSVDLPLADVAAAVWFDWGQVGAITLDANGKLAFPRPIPDGPGVYRFTLAKGSERSRPLVYIGEADQLQRRFAHYRNPGPSQRTNIRLNELLRTHLRYGSSAQLALATRIHVQTAADRMERLLDLSVRAARLLAENAALVQAQANGAVDLLNL